MPQDDDSMQELKELIAGNAHAIAGLRQSNAYLEQQEQLHNSVLEEISRMLRNNVRACEANTASIARLSATVEKLSASVQLFVEGKNGHSNNN